MTDTTSRTARIDPTGPDRRPSPLPRILLGVLALGLVAFLIVQAATHGWAAGGVILVFALLPDVALIGAFARDLGPGRMNPRNVRLYNVLHSLWIPAALIAASFLPWPELALRSGLEVLLAGVAWLAHVVVDRALGYGFRDADGRIRSRARA
jgi:hypothetical protein